MADGGLTMYTLTCNDCLKSFQWNSPNKQYCPKCLKRRDDACKQRHKEKLKLAMKKPGEHREIVSYRSEILQMVNEGLSLPRIALKIGYDLAYLKEAIAQRVTFNEIRRALRNRSNNDLEREYAAFRGRVPEMEPYIPANQVNMRAAAGRDAAWLFG
jgi:hypothetical protein